MSISPPPFSPPRSEFHESEENGNANNDPVHNVNDNNNNNNNNEYIDVARTSTCSFDLYKNAIDRLRSSVNLSSIENKQDSLEHFKPLSTRTNAWLYMRMHDDLFTILLNYLRLDNLSIRSTTLSILANIACEQASHDQVN
jgi:hypothetical protein